MSFKIMKKNDFSKIIIKKLFYQRNWCNTDFEQFNQNVLQNLTINN